MNTNKLIRLILTLLIVSQFWLPGHTLAQPQPHLKNTDSQALESPIGIETLTSDEHRLDFILTTRPFTATPDGTIHVEGLSQRIQTPGAPALPYYTTYIALPPEATATVTVEAQETFTAQAETVRPAPQPAPLPSENDPDAFSPYAIMSRDDLIGTTTPEAIITPDPAIYDQNAFYPEVTYTLSDPIYYRDVRLALLQLYPLHYHPVTHQLQQHQKLIVSLSFQGAQLTDLRPSGGHPQAMQAILAATLNQEQIPHWRHLPPEIGRPDTTPLPTGTDAYKIEVDQNGIYEVSGADLAAAGMNIAAVDPDTIQMMYRGQPVTYQFVNDNGDNDLDPNERVRFYGWAFDGPRTEKRYITHNVFWLWADGTPTYVTHQTNEAGSGHPVTTNYLATITREPENHWFGTWSDQWPTFPNEPDDWYWDYVNKPFTTITRTYDITLYHPVSTAPDAIYLAEIYSRRNLTTLPHIVNAHINDHPTYGSASWFGIASVNISHTVPTADLLSGVNTVRLAYATATSDQLYLNRLTVAYTRQLRAVGDELIFDDGVGSSREFRVAGFNEGDAADVIIWNVTTPTTTVQIDMDAGDIVAAGGTFTYLVGSTHAAGETFIATTTGNVRPAVNISQYVPPNLNPANDQADWLAITHPNFVTQALQLGSHRASVDFGHYLTHTVYIDDVINQYGYGLPLPQAIQNYLAHALATWSRAPQYVVLFGDATQNPRYLDCLGGCSSWDKDEVNYLLTDLPFIDRFQGLVPSDHTFVLLSGDDLLADMAIGRIAAKTPAEAEALVNKIIQFEQNQFDPLTYDWQQNIVFVADNTDQGGNFCLANQSTSTAIPARFDVHHLCLPDSPTITDTYNLTTTMQQHINGTGSTILNYRGHGGIGTWAGGASGSILTVNSLNFWDNPGKPVVILSADCLDGYFAWPGRPGIGETFAKLADRGSTAQWSSTGLGFTWEHTALHQSFYNGVYDQGLTAVGDAITYAKFIYHTLGYHDSELYSFTLHGDPAMQMFRPEISIDKQGPTTQVNPDQNVDFVLTVRNDGLYPTAITFTDTLPAELNYVGTTASIPISPTIVSRTLIFTTPPFDAGDAATITVTTRTVTDFVGITTNRVTATGMGLDLDSSNNADSTIITSTVPSVILTAFTATPLNNEVDLNWTTEQEINILAYRIERAQLGGPFIWLQGLGSGGYIPAQGGPTAAYQALDTTAHNGHTYRYRLIAVQENLNEIILDTQQVTLSPAVDLVTFAALPFDSQVALDWESQTEYDTDAYTIERGQDGTFTWLQELGDNGYIWAEGTPTLGAAYRLTDTTAVNGQTYTYRLIAHQAITPGANIAVVTTRTVTLMDIMLTDFAAMPLDNAAQLTWNTSTEINVGAFKMERGQDGTFTWLQTLGQNGYIPATGEPAGDTYLITDTTALNGETYTYRLIAVQGEPISNELELQTADVTLTGVTLAQFDAIRQDDDTVQLTWSTQAEVNTAAFIIQRSLNDSGSFTWLQDVGDNGFILAQGDPTNGTNYSVIDNTTVAGQTYTYKLFAVQSIQPNALQIELAQDRVQLIDQLFMPFIIRS